MSLLYESGMRVGQLLGLRHADIRSYDGEIEIIPRANSNGALAKSRSPYTVHVSKEAMELYADYLVHEYQETTHDYVFVNQWSGRIGAPMTYSTVIDLFRKLSARAGINATPHMFRHTHATDLLLSLIHIFRGGRNIIRGHRSERGSRRRFRGYWGRETGSGREGLRPPAMSTIVPGCALPKESFNGRGSGPLTPLRRAIPVSYTHLFPVAPTAEMSNTCGRSTSNSLLVKVGSMYGSSRSPAIANESVGFFISKPRLREPMMA